MELRKDPITRSWVLTGDMDPALAATQGAWGTPAPGATPREVVQRLNGAIGKVVENEAVKGKLAAVGGEPWHMTPEEMDAHTARELAELRQLVPRLGITPQ